MMFSKIVAERLKFLVLAGPQEKNSGADVDKDRSFEKEGSRTQFAKISGKGGLW
jgi:hypothetical protein